MADVTQDIQRAFDEVLAGRADVGRAMLVEMARKNPDGSVLHALAKVHWHGGDVRAAAGALEEAARRAPTDLAIWLDLGHAKMALGEWAGAAEAYRAGAEASPAHWPAHEGQARARLAAGEFDAAWGVFERAVGLFPGWPDPWVVWFDAFFQAGEVDRAVTVARRARSAFPKDVTLAAQVAFVLNYADGVPGDEVFGAHKELGELVASLSGRGAPAFENGRDPDRVLRVAFLSGDFRYHACAFFMAGLLSRLDRARVEVFCYATNEPDPTTPAFASLGEMRMLSAAGDAEIAARAVADRIDVVVDCAGWSTKSRVGAMTPRLAPVQFTWLGYPNTTGLEAIDYRIVDARTDPPGAERWATESLVRLPECFVCFAVPEHAPEPGLSGTLSAFASGGVREGPITFAAFNRVAKAQAGTLRAWARVLDRVPGSRLALKAEPGAGAHASFNARFAAAGGDVSRVVWAPFEPDPGRYLTMFRQVDIALDPFPYNGTTTTCEALLMGVPVVALEGDQHRSRVGASLLRCAGMGELVAGTPEEYVRIASDLALDPARLLRWHRETRERFLSSPVCNATLFATRFEAALREGWRAWCGGAS